MMQIEYDDVKDFYNEHIDCWNDDLFSKMTTSFIDDYVNAYVRTLTEEDVVLNAGSGGKTYTTRASMVHVDIAENTLVGCSNAYVCNILDLPFEHRTFDCVICVGTVINYCEIEKALAELSRVSKDEAYLILEYERSGSGFLENGIRNLDRVVFNHEYFDVPHKNLLYSDELVKSILEKNGFHILEAKYFNTSIPWLERYISDDLAHKLVFLEDIMQKITYFSRYSHNCILLCRKRKV